MEAVCLHFSGLRSHIQAIITNGDYLSTIGLFSVRLSDDPWSGRLLSASRSSASRCLSDDVIGALADTVRSGDVAGLRVVTQFLPLYGLYFKRKLIGSVIAANLASSLSLRPTA